MKYIDVAVMEANENSMDSRTLRKYDARLKTLLGTIEGSIPGSRGFGISGDIISMQPQAAENYLLVDLAAKTQEYLPAVSVQAIQAAFSTEGALAVQLFVVENSEG